MSYNTNFDFDKKYNMVSLTERVNGGVVDLLDYNLTGLETTLLFDLNQTDAVLQESTFKTTYPLVSEEKRGLINDCYTIENGNYKILTGNTQYGIHIPVSTSQLPALGQSFKVVIEHQDTVVQSFKRNTFFCGLVDYPSFGGASAIRQSLMFRLWNQNVKYVSSAYKGRSYNSVNKTTLNYVNNIDKTQTIRVEYSYFKNTKSIFIEMFVDDVQYAYVRAFNQNLNEDWTFNGLSDNEQKYIYLYGQGNTLIKKLEIYSIPDVDSSNTTVNINALHHIYITIDEDFINSIFWSSVNNNMLIPSINQGEIDAYVIDLYENYIADETKTLLNWSLVEFTALQNSSNDRESNYKYLMGALLYDYDITSGDKYDLIKAAYPDLAVFNEPDLLPIDDWLIDSISFNDTDPVYNFVVAGIDEEHIDDYVIWLYETHVSEDVRNNNVGWSLDDFITLQLTEPKTSANQFNFPMLMIGLSVQKSLEAPPPLENTALLYLDALDTTSYDDGVSTSWIDISPNNNDIILDGTSPSFNTNSFYFDNYKTMTVSNIGNTGGDWTHTVACWFNATGNGSTNIVYSIGETGLDGSNTRRYTALQIQVHSATQYKLNLTHHGLNMIVYDPVMYVNNGEWNHFVYIRSGAVASSYLNGVFINTVSDLPLNDINTDTQMILGSKGWGTNTVPFVGGMGHISIYEYELTSNDVIQLYNLRAVDYGRVVI